MQLMFLGTSSGSPTRQRNVSGLALVADAHRDWVLVDCGEATQHRLLSTPLSTQRLCAICITHMHGDHCYGLPGLLASAQLNGRTAPLQLIGPAALQPFLQAVMATTALELSFPLIFHDVTGLSGQCELGPVAVSAHALSHRVPSFAYRFVERRIPRRLLQAQLERDGVPRGPLWGALQRGENVFLDGVGPVRGEDYTEPSWSARQVLIGGDNDRPDLLADACRGLDLLVHEATYDEDTLCRIGPAPMHSSGARVARVAEKAGVSHLILTHFSPRYQVGGGHGLPLSRIEREAGALYGGALWLAEDYDCFELTRDRRLLHTRLSR